MEDGVRSVVSGGTSLLPAREFSGPPKLSDFSIERLKRGARYVADFAQLAIVKKGK